MKIRPLESKLCHAGRQAEGRTDISKLIVAFRNFANVPKNKIKMQCIIHNFVSLSGCLVLRVTNTGYGRMAENVVQTCVGYWKLLRTPRSYIMSNYARVWSHSVDMK